MKRAGAEREQAGIAGQQVEPDRREREHQERDHHGVEQEVAADQRDDDEARSARMTRDADPVLQDRKHRHVGGVARLVLAGLAVEHAALRSAR